MPEFRLSSDPLALVGEGAKWLDAIRATRRSRAAVRAANVLYDAGAIVIALRAQRDRMHELLGPLRNFNPAQWPREKRQQAIEELLPFARSPQKVFDDMVTHELSLRQLDAKPKERVNPLRDEIADLASNVTHVGAPIEGEELKARAEQQHWASDLEDYVVAGQTRFGPVSEDLAGPDTLIQRFLPALLWLVDEASDEKEIEALRRLADGLLVTRSKEGDVKLDDVVRKAEIAFGTLTGILLKQFPELPSPTWAA